MRRWSLPLLASCALTACVSYAQGGSDDLKSASEPLILQACQPCHARSASPTIITSSGDVDWTAVENHADRLLSRVEGGSMPPPRSSQAQQFTAAQRQTLVQYLRSVVEDGGDEPDPEGLPLSTLSLPAGFKIELFARAEGARSLAVHPDGVVFVGTGGFSNVDPDGRVHAIVPTADGRKVMALAWDLNNPNGVALVGNDLYVAEETRILKFADAVGYAKANITRPGNRTSAPYTVIYDDLPVEGSHSWKYLGYGPDQKLYVNLGAPCNICLPDRDTFATIKRLNTDGSGLELVARGVRNTVGFDWHPATGDLWFTDNGRDSLGDDIPPDELNRLPQLNADFGYPYCHGKTIADPDFGRGQNCASPAFTKPEVELGAHVAALGLTFYKGNRFPTEYKNATFIAEHGSWNRRAKSGYRLTIVQFNNGTPSYRPFVSGWLNDSTQRAWGRPVDVKNHPDGSLLLSDDQAGAVYRIFYRGP